MANFLFILVIISLLLSPIPAFRSPVLASEPLEMPKQGILDNPQEIQAENILSTLKKILRVFSWFEKTIKKIWSFFNKTYYWVKEKIYQPVSY